MLGVPRWVRSPFIRRIYLPDLDVLGTRIAPKDKTVMLPAMLDTSRQTQVAVHEGPVTRQRTVRRHRAVCALRTPAYAARAVVDHGRRSFHTGIAAPRRLDPDVRSQPDVPFTHRPGRVQAPDPGYMERSST